jgi:hypothetical protein
MRGVVLDPIDALIIDARIVIENAQFKRELKSSENGDFVIELPAGKYKVSVETEFGFRPLIVTDIDVVPDVITSYKFRMEIHGCSDCELIFDDKPKHIFLRRVPKDFAYQEVSAVIEVVKPAAAKSLSGIVELPTGGALPDVLVERVSHDWKTRLDAVFSDSDGRFSFGKLPQGTYYLRLSKSGFSALRVKVLLRKESETQLKYSLPCRYVNSGEFQCRS